MSLNKGQNNIQYWVTTSAAALVLIAVNTFLIAQKSSKNANAFNIELKNLSSNLESLNNETKNISTDLVPSKKRSQRWNECFKIHPFGLTKKGQIILNWIKP